MNKPTDKKPADMKEYRAWLESARAIDPLNQVEAYYTAVTDAALRDFRSHPLWNSVRTTLASIHDKYRVDEGYDLLLSTAIPEIVIKPFESLLDKTFRRNVCQNANWPEAPADGWLLPPEWCWGINDSLRTLITVKYLDGVEHLANAIIDLANAHGIEYRLDWEAKDDGYYAAHLYVFPHLSVPTVNWGMQSVKYSIEVQITTQLQEVIRKLLHRYYEQKRSAIITPERCWQWQINDEQFVANNLGHVLHLIEGLIVDIKAKQRSALP